MELRLAKFGDFELFYKMKSDINNIKWGGWTSAPIKDNFLIWYNRQLQEDSNRLLLILFDNQKAVGYGSIDNNYISEVSYGVLTEYTGKGYGTEIIKQANRFCISPRIEAWVADDNIPSIRCFEKNGYTKTDEMELRNLPLLGGEHKFYKWVKIL